MADALITRRGGAGGEKITNSKAIKCFSESSIDANTFVSTTCAKPYKPIYERLNADTSDFGRKIYVYAIPLDELRTLVFYKDNNYGVYAVVHKRTASGTEKGTPLKVNNYSFNYQNEGLTSSYLPSQYNTLLLSDGKVFYANPTTSGKIEKVLVLSIDNLTISAIQSTPPTDWSSYSQMFGYSSKVIEISENKILSVFATYTSSGGAGTKQACILFVADNGSITFSETVSIGVPVSSVSISYDTVEVVKLSSSKVVVSAPISSGSTVYAITLNLSLGETAETSSINLATALQIGGVYYGLKALKISENLILVIISAVSTASSSNFVPYILLLRVQSSGNLVSLDSKIDESVGYKGSDYYRTVINKENDNYVYARFMLGDSLKINTFTISNEEIVLDAGNSITLRFGTESNYYIAPDSNAGIRYASVMQLSQEKVFMVLPIQRASGNRGLAFITVEVKDPKNNYSVIKEEGNISPLPFYGSFACINEVNGRYALGIALFKTFSSVQGKYFCYTENLSFDEVFSPFVNNSLDTKEIDGVTKHSLLPRVAGKCMVLADS